MKGGIFNLIFMALISLAANANEEKQTSSFRVDGKKLFTVSEFIKRANLTYPDSKTNWVAAPDVEHLGVVHRTLKITTKGIIAGSKVLQKLTYIETHKGLWRMRFVEGEGCVKATVLKNDEWVKDWVCESFGFPLSGVLNEFFLVDDKGVNLDELSASWGKKVTINTGEPKKKEVKLLSLGDMKEIILQNKGSWRAEEETWKNLPALRVFVKTKDDGYDISQNFLYAIEGELLVLKEIDGVFCRSVEFERNSELIKQKICDDAQGHAYNPTSVTPFKFKLINSEEVTEKEIEEDKAGKKVELSCGNLAINYEEALKFHFENITLSIGNIKGHKRAVSNITKVLDPMGLLVKGLDDKVKLRLSKELSKNFLDKNSECKAVLPVFNDLKNQILSANVELQKLLQILKNVDFNLSLIDIKSLNEKQKKFLKALDELKKPVLEKASKRASLDFATANLLVYYKKALDLIHSPEELLTASYLKLDEYSGLLISDEKRAEERESLIGKSGKKNYFGLSVATGVSDHYIFNVHPETFRKYKLKTGDVIKEVNGVKASELSAQKLDDILLATDKKIDLKISGREKNVVLESSALDIMKNYYSVEPIVTEKSDVFLKIQISEFHAGLSKSLKASILEILETQKIDGYILDLKSNRGGNIDEALSVANFFLREEKVLSYYTVGSRGGKDVTPVISDKEDHIVSESVPLVIQVNEKTESAAEMLVASLKAHKRGVIIGAQTFGKHVGQMYFPVELSSGRKMMMLMTAIEVFDPNGLSLNGKGVVPDINLSLKEHVKFDDGISKGEDYKVEKEVTLIAPLANDMLYRLQLYVLNSENVNWL